MTEPPPPVSIVHLVNDTHGSRWMLLSDEVEQAFTDWLASLGVTVDWQETTAFGSLELMFEVRALIRLMALAMKHPLREGDSLVPVLEAALELLQEEERDPDSR